MPNDTPSPTLTPEVLAGMRKVLTEYETAAPPSYRDYLSYDLFDAFAPHLTALLAAAQRVQELEAKLEQALRDRYEALSVTSRDGLLASEWVARTGKAEREADRLRAKVAELEESARVHAAELTAIDDALGPLTEATRQAQVRGLVEDRARLDWLERASWTDPRVGNGIVVFPSFRGGVRVIDLHGLGDEDGSNIGDQLANTGDTLREAIDAARQAGKEEGT